MISKVDEDRLAFAKQEKSLRVLCDEMYVQKMEMNIHSLQMRSRKQKTKSEATTLILLNIRNYIAQVAFEEVIVFPNNKYRYDNRYQFSFNQTIDDRYYRNGSPHKIGLRILTAYRKEDPLALGMLSYTEKCVVIRMSDDYAYLSETEEMKKIGEFLK